MAVGRGESKMWAYSSRIWGTIEVPAWEAIGARRLRIVGVCRSVSRIDSAGADWQAASTRGAWDLDGPCQAAGVARRMLRALGRGQRSTGPRPEDANVGSFVTVQVVSGSKLIIDQDCGFLC